MTRIEISASQAYEVRIGAGLLAELGKEAASVTRGKVMLVTDENVAPHCLRCACQSLESAGLETVTMVLPAGERTKCFEYYVNLINALAENRFTRSDLVIALGGGVIGDLAGFAAATYLRGIPLLNVPTTLLAMVDASVGGKSAIDLPAGKNLLGAIKQPKAVLCDVETLRSLPEPVFRDGCAELIKTAIIFDPEMFQQLQAQGTAFDLEALIAASVRHKAAMVQHDEFDHGARQMLNYGHTFGHAIELCSGYTVSHGCAVSIGMAMMARLFSADQKAIHDLLLTFGLPVRTKLSAHAIAAAALADKKRRGTQITLAVSRAVGQCALEQFPIARLEALVQEGL